MDIALITIGTIASVIDAAWLMVVMLLFIIVGLYFLKWGLGIILMPFF